MQLGSVRFRSFFQSSELDLRTLTTTRTMPSHTQIDCRCLPTINLGVVNNPKPYSLTTTIIHNTHPLSLSRYRHQHPPALPMVTSRPQRLHHTSTQQEHDESATSLLKNTATTPRHRMNERPPCATLLWATWQPDDVTHRPQNAHQPSTAHYKYDAPQHTRTTPQPHVTSPSW